MFSKLNNNGSLVENVVLQTSSNMVEESGKKIQDALLFSDREIFRAYRDYWFHINILGNEEMLNSYRYFNAENSGKTLRAYFFPKRKNNESYGKDNIQKILKDIDDPASARIYFMHAKWNKDRKNLLEELDGLEEAGADITLIVNENIDNEIEKLLEKSNSRVIQIEKDHLNIHSKIVLIESTRNGEPEYQVLTGSHNLTEKSLQENFEVLLQIKDKDLYAVYLEYIEDVISNQDPD